MLKKDDVRLPLKPKPQWMSIPLFWNSPIFSLYEYKTVNMYNYVMDLTKRDENWKI
jgi:hypothetical protein